MPVYKDSARNTWFVRYRLKDPVTGKRQEKTKRGFATQKEAKLYLAQQQIDAVPTTSVTFAAMNERYVRYKNPRQATQDQEMMRVQKYMQAFKDKPMSKITKTDLMEWRAWLDAQPISTATKNYCLSVVAGTYRFGNAFYEIPNISMVVKRFKKRQDEIREMQTWTVDEFNRFIACVDEEVYALLYTFLYWTGCRRGEALALRKKDYDPQTGTVYIHHGVCKYHSEGFKPLKNNSSVRRIKLDTVLNKMVGEACRSLSDEDYFIFGIIEPLGIKAVENRMKQAIKKAGVKQIRLHDMRHSFATNAINHGVNIVALSKYMGHATIEQTLATYSHLLEKTADEMNVIMSNMHAEN